MSATDDETGEKSTAAPAKSKNTKDTTAQSMIPTNLTENRPTPTDNWWDGQLKALYQSVLEEPLPDDMMKLVHAPKQKPGGVKAKGLRKPEDE